MDEKKSIVYNEIDCDGLSSCLAENDLLDNTKNVPADDLYQVDGLLSADGKGIEVVKTIRPHWATEFFTSKQMYEELIMQYSKPIVYEDNTKSTESGSEGIDQ